MHHLYFAMLGIGFAIPDIAVWYDSQKGGAAPPPPTIALQADFSNTATTEAWVFW